MSQAPQKHSFRKARDRSAPAFEVAELLLALGWQQAVRSVGYQLTVATDRSEAEEVIEVRVPGLCRPLFTVRRHLHTVRLTGPGGQIFYARSITDALDCISPLTQSTWRSLSKSVKSEHYVISTKAGQRRHPIKAVSRAVLFWFIRTCHIPLQP